MNEAEVIDICREAIMVMLKLAGPMLLAGLVIGVAISLIQAVTQIQEMTLTFVPKLIVIFGLTVLLMPYMLAQLSGFTEGLAARIVAIGTGG